MIENTRGFPVEEFESRLARAQSAMSKAGLDALLLTTEPEIRYFTGFLTRFWESPTRPWFLIIPSDGQPIAVIPAIGAALMEKTWIRDIRTWNAPDLEDDGISLLAETLTELTGSTGRIGLPMGHETHLRMPLADFDKLCNALTPQHIVADAGIMRTLRLVKSDAEIAKISHACQIADRAFARVSEICRPQASLSTVFRHFQMLCLEEGADAVPYLAGAASQNGYDDVISPAHDNPLKDGDILMLDTGLVWDGYFCDFDRNFAITQCAPEVQAAHARLIEATDAGFQAAQPGKTASDLFEAMDKVLTGGNGTGAAGRLGHGLGMQLTEPPSLIPTDHTILRDGMVLTLEPGIEVAPGKILVHEENIVIEESGARWLSRPAPPEMPTIRTTE